MIINHNMTAMGSYRQLSINTSNQAKSTEKLSSGLRINRAGDDAAGLAISEKMRGQIRGLDQASRNAQDGISMIQTAEGALSETHSILQRMRELANQSANDTNVGVDREEIQKEMNQLSSEINRIGNTTEFNTQKLLNSGGDEKVVASQTVTRGGAAGATGAFAQARASVAEVLGDYTITVGATPLVAGKTVTIDGETFTAVAGMADASKGEFSIGANANDQAASLGAAINANAKLSARFENAVISTNTIQLVERAGQATGTAPSIAVGGTGAGTATVAANTASVKEVTGKYTFNVDKAFEIVGASISVGGQSLTAVSANANPTLGQFNIGSDEEEQAKSIAAAINGHSTLGGRFEAVVTGKTITLTEKAGEATGTNITAPTDTAGTAVAGKYTITPDTLMEAGGKFTVDGVDIKVVDDVNDAGLANGTSILKSANLTDQANRLQAAINTNASLNFKYTASSNGGKVTLDQKTGYQSIDAPEVTTHTNAKEKFEAKFQIGANSGQSMTIEIEDMRSAALKVTGTQGGETIKAKNGSEARYVTTQNVSNGTTNTNVEFALDVSTHDRATAAVSVINDAIEKVSAQRSQLGAFQNRLEHTINNLNTSSENLTAAESRIRDTDMAKTVMENTKNGILAQAAQAMLAQANQAPQQVLQLLR